MGKRLTRSESRERTRAQLLQAAEMLIGRSGYHGVSLDSIAEQAGYTKGAIYANFASKEDLFLTLIDQHTAGWDVDDWLAKSRPVPGPRPTPGQPAVRPDDAEWTRLSVEFWLTATRSPAIRKKLAITYARVRARLVSRRQLDHATPSPSLSELAVLILALDLGLAMQEALDPDSVPPSVYERAYCMILNEATTDDGQLTTPSRAGDA